MPDISELLRLGMMNRQAPMQAVDQLGTTLAGMIERRGNSNFMQQATKYFMDAENVTPDAIKQFMSYYPNVDPQEVLKIAGSVAAQKKSQRIKDLGSTIMKAAAENGGSLPEEKFSDIFKNANGEDLQEVMSIMQAFKKAHPDVKWEKLSPGETAHQTIGGKPTGQTLKGEAKPEDEPKTAYSAIRKELKGTINPETGKVYTEQEIAKAAQKPDRPDNAHNVQELFSADGKTAQKFQYNPETKRYDIPVGGKYPVKSQVPNVNIMPGQPQQTQFIDAATGNPLIFDRKSGTYKIASVEGGAMPSPRLENPSATERERTANLSTIQDQLKRVQKSYKPEYVGIVSGRAGAVTQLVDSKEAEFRQIIQDVKDSLLRARSGAQINEQEYARLAKLVPSFNDSEAQFKGKMTAFETTLNKIATERSKAQQQGGVYIRGKGANVKEMSNEQLLKELGL